MTVERGLVGIVEDDAVMGESLQQSLELDGWRTAWWRTGEAALSALAGSLPDLVICDIRLPDMNGDELFQRAHVARAAPPFLFMTAYGQIEQAIALVRAGAVDYFTKPFDVARLLERARWTVMQRVAHDGHGLLGVSPAMHRIEAMLERLAGRPVNLLLTGETGVGKEVCARHLHHIASPRQPFMAVNCAAIPAELLESELFGHERGAFSGAHQRHLGYAERAGSGTLFLDEIAEMPLPLQSKLLRVIEERAFHRVGGESAVPLKARVVAAANRDLAVEARAGRFRRDLFYRLNVVTIEVPPLRVRQEDIPWLLAQFVERHASELSTVKGVSTLAEDACLAHDWPGNARELRNRVERAMALALGDWLMPADLFPELREPATNPLGSILPLAAVRDAAERRQIERALIGIRDDMCAERFTPSAETPMLQEPILKQTGGQIGEAARLLGVSRTTLWEKMRRLECTDEG